MLQDFDFEVVYADGEAARSIGSVEYSGEVEGLPRPVRRFEQCWDLDHRQVFRATTHTYSGITAGKLTEDECSLPAYGLPEMQDEQTSSTFAILTGLITVIAGLGCGVIALRLIASNRNLRISSEQQLNGL